MWVATTDARFLDSLCNVLQQVLGSTIVPIAIHINKLNRDASSDQGMCCSEGVLTHRNQARFSLIFVLIVAVVSAAILPQIDGKRVKVSGTAFLELLDDCSPIFRFSNLVILQNLIRSAGDQMRQLHCTPHKPADVPPLQNSRPTHLQHTLLHLVVPMTKLPQWKHRTQRRGRGRTTG